MATTFKEQFGAVLEEIGWTQRLLSERSGVNAQQIQKLLSGEIKDPRISTVKRLAKGMKIPVVRLVEFGE